MRATSAKRKQSPFAGPSGVAGKGGLHFALREDLWVTGRISSMFINSTLDSLNYFGIELPLRPMSFRRITIEKPDR
jgi:hypothetical protein